MIHLKLWAYYRDEIETLKDQNDALAKALGNATIERDWAMGKLKSMDKLAPSVAHSRKKVFTSFKDCQNKIYGYLLEKYWFSPGQTKRVHVPKSNQVWNDDITYIRTKGRFMYFAAIIDWNSKATRNRKY
ncbi:hypothetical protein [Cardinium endosymbiont of Bemisia tabaci]|uniref:hypothetical protein n=1 Tax=Cardinium endosymbiont of Bemisia tabaci TaxID=672794 RepID=UPI000553A0D3|nr:hypothetical protein [Cardinium endosymbiont of Bemisia tabaci]